jgi:hypothetical protein
MRNGRSDGHRRPFVFQSLTERAGWRIDGLERAKEGLRKIQGNYSIIVFNDIGVPRCASCIPMRDAVSILALRVYDKPCRFRQLQTWGDIRELS